MTKNTKNKFQVYSDLHLEFYKSFPIIEPIADYLILAGDIGNFSNNNLIAFFDYINVNWKKTFYVLGNHEYYSSNKNFNKLKIKFKETIDNYENIILLDKNEYILDDIVILGCTMWTYNDNDIKDYINDFKKIKYFDLIRKRKYNITPNIINNFHIDEKQWLFEKINKYYDNNKILVITHFPMIQQNTSSPEYDNQEIIFTNYFANNFEKDLENFKDITFIAGHTHYSYDFIFNDNKFISNQMGYPSEEYKTFEENKTICI